MNTQEAHQQQSKEKGQKINSEKEMATKETNSNRESSQEALIAAKTEAEQQLLRLQADFDNYQKRTKKKELDFLGRANERLLQKIVPIVNDFERALSVKVADNHDNTLKGVKMIHEKILQVLGKEDVKPIEVKVGDTIEHEEWVEAISSMEVAEEKQKGTIIQILERGYLYKGKPLLRTKVIVGR